MHTHNMFSYCQQFKCGIYGIQYSTIAHVQHSTMQMRKNQKVNKLETTITRVGIMKSAAAHKFKQRHKETDRIVNWTWIVDTERTIAKCRCAVD